MNSHRNRARLSGVLVALAAALALVALPGLASGHRGHDDPAPAGTVASFDHETGELTIDLGGGGSIAGLVTRRTHIRCDNGRHRGLRHRLRGKRRHHRASISSRGGEDESSDDRRSGEPEPGDDRGGQGVEPGEDNHAEDRRHGRCNASLLTEGATVKYAVVILVDGKAIYKAVVLPKPKQEEEEGGSEEEAPASE